MREPGLEGLHHLRRQRKRPGPGILVKEEAEQVEEGSIRSSHISREATALDGQNVVGGSVSFCLGNQPRFANASIARNMVSNPSDAMGMLLARLCNIETRP